MPPARETIRALRRLQATIRAPDTPSGADGRGRQVPEDLATLEVPWLTLSRKESDAFDQALNELRVDVSFEHLDPRSVEKLVWRFTCEAHLERRTDHVAAFIRAHAREARSVDVFFTLRHLDVTEEFILGGANFLPISSARVPAVDELAADPHVRGILRTPAIGTNGSRIVE